MGRPNTKILLILLVLVLIGVYVVVFRDTLTLEFLQGSLDTFNNFYEQHLVLVPLVFVLIYIVSTAVSLPLGTLLTLLAGFLFGLFFGTVLVVIGSVVGATLATALVRYLFLEWCEKRFGNRMRKIQEHIDSEGLWYLFTLRLVPGAPFFLVNIAAGFTRIPLFYYALVSMVGMFPGTVVYVNAGAQLALIETAGDILSPVFISSFVLLALFPLAVRSVYRLFKGNIKKTA